MAGGLSDASVEAVSGSVGSVLALVATYPLKTIYTLQALSAGNDSTAALSVIDILKKYKLGVYSGLNPNIVESAVSSGVYFYLYSKLRHFVVTCRESLHTGAGAAPAPASSGGSTKNKDIGVLSSLLVAALAGAGNQLITMPASVVATRMQAQQKLVVEGRAERASASAGAVISRIHQESGVGGFWAGLLPSMVLVSNPAIQYMLYEQFLRALRKWKAQRAATASAAEAAASAPAPAPTPCSQCMGAKRAAPARKATDGPELTSASAAAAGADKASEVAGACSRESCSKCGGSGVVTVAAPVAASAQPQAPVKLTPLEIFLASAAAKVGATIATYWLVVVKSRMQAAGKGGDFQYKGTWDALSTIWRDEGLGGFFKGLRSKILQTALNAALMLMLKEQVYSATRQLLSTRSVNPGLKSLATAAVTRGMRA
mmetsp:Transcript_9609/g.23829  ORF Transcript_9609/g.23829 Transcript_9609/m.23829 type:complete len:430 (-) Transcript_9609:780-2069(-)|eukprot:CAMPEP_0202873972 /NCGR_PEP_ID=MMETSP1391-20130828/24405_1 /ASSEMBLY_ACC=CAM_ASM_000867 /TAXON_ID=1034604 /ORGANISM="Chlamydomonas leiostraca, Strain SAG 11-49" /LENGTH=429 /DNA_ID=CAMNT_0049555297 /DNA_START=258 /DNA_END=1547 /DNA_ORIENTATION=-